MNHDLLASIAVFAFAMFAGIEGIGEILRARDRKRFIARLTEATVTRVETEQPGFKLGSDLALGDKIFIDATASHWKAGTGPACSRYVAQLAAEAIMRARLKRDGVKIGSVLIGGHGLPVESEMERERR